MKIRFLLTIVILCAIAARAMAQSFDLRPQQDKKQEKKVNTELGRLLSSNDVNGMRSFLIKNPATVNDNSSMLTLGNKTKSFKPLFYDTVERTLKDECSIDMCEVVLETGCELESVYNGQTPIYLVLSEIACRKKDDCNNAVEILKLMLKRKDFDINHRYRSLPPPLNFLMQTNQKFLGGRFSKDYIPDEVLRLLLEKGASVNSYTEDGESLMTFAIETENQFLQSYFIANGVNLQHTNNSGNNAIHLAINGANIGLLKQMIANGSAKIDVHSFSNDTEEIRKKQPALYAFLADECSRNAASYEDLTMFRKRFSDKTEMVQQKYEALARTETNAAKDFKDMTEVRKRYPDLQKITEPKCLSIYKKHADEVDRIYQEALALSKSNGEISPRNMVDWRKRESIHNFVETFKDYDPHNMLEKARETENFTDVYNCLFEAKCTYYERFLHRSWLGGHYFDASEAKNVRGIIVKGKELMKKTSKYGFAPFYSPENLSKLTAAESNLTSWIDAANSLAAKRQQQEQLELCEGCKIDGSKTTFPKGYTEGWNTLIAGRPAESAEEGTIVLKNGKWVKWKFVYEGATSGEISHISTRGFVDRNYPSVQKMVEDIIRKCRETYCR